MKCYVGGNPNPIIDDCFKSTGRILVNGDTTLNYSYDINEGNHFLNTIQLFSLNVRSQLFECSSEDHPRCPYVDIKKYHTYYGAVDYANIFVLAAAESDTTAGKYDKGIMDFTQLSEDGRKGM